MDTAWTAPAHATPVPGPDTHREHPWVFAAALLVALAAVVGGAATAVAAYRGTDSPAGAVRAYFDAIRRADAPAALGFGDVPNGPHTLLTSAALAEQARVAALVDVHVGAVARSGSRAEVAVSYTLRYSSADIPVSTHIAVHRANSAWRLDAVAVRTRVALRSAQQRASVLGGQLPVGDVLAFPGAPPISFDTDYLALDPTIGIVPGETSSAAPALAVIVTRAGQVAMQQAVLTAVRACLMAAHPATTCPLPSQRYLPGSLHGTVTGSASDVSVSLDVTQVGTLELTADVPVQATGYRRLDFDNRMIPGQGRVVLEVRAIAAAHDPLQVSWLAP